jgi:intein/homing endonuclease
MTARTASWLNIAYQGNPQRIPRYYQFQEMDNDSDINTALDTIADFCTQSEEQSDEPFEVAFNGDPNESELRIIKQMLARWIKLNNLRSRLWYMFRDTIKNGDAFFLRDPETQEWLWLDHFTVELVKVDESKGKVPDEYIVRGLDYNRQAMFATKQADPNSYRTQFGTATVHGARPLPGIVAPSQFTMVGAGTDPRQRMAQGPQSQEMCVIDADHVIHLSLSIGNDINWPFGSSILEPIFKTYKQKELLEDAIIIYRVQRAPERRIFYIDVGTMPPERAKRHIEAIKNDIHQRRIPNRVGGGSSILDAAYNPLCLSLNTLLHLVDGRVLSLAAIINEYHDGKVNWVYSCDPVTGEIMQGPITWAGITRRNAEVVRVTLADGGTLTVTPDHKFPLLGGEKVSASDLTPEHMLICFNRADGLTTHVASVEPLEERIDTGTITVDKDEIYHPHHNFAVAENIFLCNSINDDYFFASSCLSLRTEIYLLDGRTLTLGQIIDEHEKGKENWVYSQNRETHQLEPGRIVWAGPTRRSAELVRVTLDSGDFLDVTPDHRFIARDGQEIEAAKLNVGQSLMPLYLRFGRTGPRQKNAGYTRFLCNATSKTKFVHSQFCPKPAGRGHVVHHVDFDGKNNNPTNLRVMTWFDHEMLHKNSGTYSLNRQWNDPAARDKLIAGMHKLYAHRTEEFDAALASRNSTNGRNTWVNANEEEIARRKARVAALGNAAKVKYSTEMFKRLVAVASELHGFYSREALVNLLKDDYEFRSAFERANSDTHRAKGRRPISESITKETISKTLKVGGFDSWSGFQHRFGAHNHTVVSVERLPHREDTGDITIETPSGSHIFAVAAGVFIHNSDGRGSKVETLPGGECLSLDTKIPLLDGRTLPLSTIISEFEKGEQLWAYSCNPGTGEIVPGIINWAGITRRKTQVLRLTLDNGESIVATPDHHFPVDGRGKTEAKDISVGDCLIPFYSRRTDNFEQVFDNKGKCWVDTHRMVSGYLDGSSQTVRHIDADTLNNDPANLMPESGTSANPPDEETLIDGSVCNHHVVAIEYLDEPMDTGTITIDGLQVYHGYHTFALDAGVFTYNSTGEISDLSYFSKKLSRGLRVPTSYLNIGDDQTTGVTFNDGKLGAAMIQEYRFSKYCMRLQSLLAPVFDKEFKRYLNKNGIEIESSLFELRFNPPQSFTRYRQIELDSQRVGVYQGVAENKKLSERFKLQRYLGLSEDELIENEELWAEENADRLRRKTGVSPAESDAGAGLSAVGLHPEGDLGGLDDMPAADEGMEGPETAPGGPGAGAGGPMGAPAPAAPATGGGAPPM